VDFERWLQRPLPHASALSASSCSCSLVLNGLRQPPDSLHDRAAPTWLFAAECGGLLACARLGVIHWPSFPGGRVPAGLRLVGSYRVSLQNPLRLPESTRGALDCRRGLWCVFPIMGAIKLL